MQLPRLTQSVSQSVPASQLVMNIIQQRQINNKAPPFSQSPFNTQQGLFALMMMVVKPVKRELPFRSICRPLCETLYAHKIFGTAGINVLAGNLTYHNNGIWLVTPLLCFASLFNWKLVLQLLVSVFYSAIQTWQHCTLVFFFVSFFSWRAKFRGGVEQKTLIGSSHAQFWLNL